ncbi:MAG TPA: TadE/TadG family type IV pilus assembly protein [Herpetosiphonaceae bacterium]|nr:TadE/TadG family type IV pilus assembly protein [Herpetosiphonaceae bacterium]
MRIRSRRKNGQSLVELAISLPLLLLILLGLADFGFLLYGHVQVANATREGARAGSLYLSSRFHYTSCFDGPTCPDGYGDGGDCWTLRDWVENTLAERNRDNNTGCPTAGYKPDPIHSFGWLSPTACSANPTGTNGPDCWWLRPLTYFGSSTEITGKPIAGEPLQVRVAYRYNLPFVGDLIPVFPGSIMIEKTVIMKVQNN